MVKIEKKRLDTIKRAAGVLLVAAMAAVLVMINLEDATDSQDLQAESIEAASKYADIKYFEDFEMACFDGSSFSTADLAGYRLTIVNVWEPYCASCLKEMPDLGSFAEEYSGKGVQLVGVQGNACVYPEDVELGISEVMDIGVKYPMLLADERFTEQVLPILNNAFPGTFVLDSEGRILDFIVGAKSMDFWREYCDGR